MSLIPITQTVATSSVKILAQRNMMLSGATAWVAATAYGQGAIVKSGGRLYMAIAADTSGTDTPSGTANYTDDAGMVWRFVPRSRRGGVTLQNNGSVAVSIAFGYDAVAGSGIVLAAGGSFSVMNADTTDVQNSIHAIAASGTAAISILEW